LKACAWIAKAFTGLARKQPKAERLRYLAPQ